MGGTGGNGTSLPGNYGGTGAGLDHAWAKWAGLEIHGADGSLFNIGTNQTMITDSFGAADIGGTAWIGYVGHFGGGFLAGVAIEDANGGHYTARPARPGLRHILVFLQPGSTSRYSPVGGRVCARPICVAWAAWPGKEGSS